VLVDHIQIVNIQCDVAVTVGVIVVTLAMLLRLINRRFIII